MVTHEDGGFAVGTCLHVVGFANCWHDAPLWCWTPTRCGELCTVEGCTVEGCAVEGCMWQKL